jgi:hypothetical protein
VRPDEEVLLHVGAVAGGRDPPVAQHGPDLLLVVDPRLGEVEPPRLHGSFVLGSSGRRLGPLPAQAGHDGGELGVHLDVGEGEAEVSNSSSAMVRPRRRRLVRPAVGAVRGGVGV